MNHDGFDLPSRYFGVKQMEMIGEISKHLLLGTKYRMVGYGNEPPAIVYTHTYEGTAEDPHAIPVL